MTTFRQIALASLAAPLAFGLAACGSEPTDGEAPEGEPVENVAAPEGTQWVDTVTVTEADGYRLGNPDAPIKLIEYGSLTCGACANFATTGMEPLKEKYVASGRVSYELRNQIHNAFDLTLARLVRCGAPESFHPLSEQVWLNLGAVLEGAQANQQALESAMQQAEDQRFVAVAEAAGFLDFFAARGVSRDQARQCLSDADSIEAIANNSDKQSQELNVTGTPSFIINGRNVGTQSWATLEPMLQNAGAR
ncbi:thioredoxin domain-containing protein [Pelagerythrobacter marensis]|uniref:Protein-disulfide isomerase n=1 Tax=Pelagerythrobacter marensis TaxID=543877 RepID=A0A0G3X8R2_9SPHN|nr:thioredoxin domain-containing protein [Pelagerythrobacter marensis]AKM07542.1 Protein-disulfide isomerase [Pelagerythrobacter marensis]